MSEQTLPELMREALRLSTRLEAVTDEMYRVAKRLAEASHTFEQADATAWITVRTELADREGPGGKWLVKDYEAEVTKRTSAEAKAFEQVKAEDKALDNAARNLRGQLSACQSVAAALREEMRLAGGPS